MNGETGEIEQFEPVDAREILQMPHTVYSVPDQGNESMGERFDPTVINENLNVWQLNGDDAELQTGLSVDKYGRNQVVKAVPVNAELVAEGPQGYEGRLAQVAVDAEAAEGVEGEEAPAPRRRGKNKSKAAG
jgi:hypothetical protein